ncbi:MAG TPA: M15 family metallopeptidase [Verrucomicrobiota bacterium]|nr:M15 family metallopeptidase [Verrucomicrobiota bacterium]
MTASQKQELANRGWEAAAQFFKKRGEITAPAASPYVGGTQREIGAEAEFSESESEDGEFSAENFEADERFEFEFEAPASTGTPELALIQWGGRSFQVACAIAPRIERLLHAAKADGINLTVNSAYRDPAQQVAMRRRHCGPTQFDIYQKPPSQCTPPTARPGTSNHEKGLAIDFGHNGGRLDPNGPAFAWLSRHAATYGLINYKKEPWHWSVDGN